MKGLTERQIRRREKILAAARELLTKRGVEGVTMRELAKQSGVTPKTLYHQFGSKEQLLHTAVEERFRYYYRMIDEEVIEYGIDRLMFIIDTVAATARSNLAYAKALSPLLSDSSNQSFNAIRNSTFRRAVDQIVDEGDFLDWIDVDLIESILQRHIGQLYMTSWMDASNWTFVPKLAKLEVCLMLDSVSMGYTKKRAATLIKALHSELKGKRLN